MPWHDQCGSAVDVRPEKGWGDSAGLSFYIINYERAFGFSGLPVEQRKYVV